jgi:predicted RNA-binding Zn-ribbon protein involved in translation (DUF1610 family)
MTELLPLILKIVENLLENPSNLEKNLGVCLSCGHVMSNIEPDAMDYECEQCGEELVYGLEEITLMLYS